MAAEVPDPGAGGADEEATRSASVDERTALKNEDL